jgi:hypothetical protein
MAVWQALTDGTSDLVAGPYTISYQTVRAYRDRELALRRQGNLTELAKGDADEAISVLARRLLAMAERVIIAQEKAKTPDVDEAKRAADLLAKVRPLIGKHPAKGPTENPQQGPRDTLVEALNQKPNEKTTTHQPAWAAAPARNGQ